MVIQADRAAPVWGWAAPGTRVEVSGSWGASSSVVTEDSGAWRLSLPTPPPGGPHEITVAGVGGTRTIRDVLAGEVWVASGQSNMHMRVRYLRPQYRGVVGRRDAIATSDDPMLRILDVEERISAAPLRETNGAWTKASRETTGDFSAVAYFFGRALRDRLGVPVGVITTDWGGTRAEAWTPLDDLGAFPGVADEVAAVREMAANGVTESADAGDLNRHSPAALYHGMIAPLGEYASRGFVWYQGESNRQNAVEYAELFPTMINGWRRDTANPDASFLFVQIAPFRYGREPDDRTALVRESQRRSLRVPNTAMVVTADVGEPRDIHPRDKRTVGERLALAAFATTYGIEDESALSPLPIEAIRDGDSIAISFDHTGGELVCVAGEPSGFEIRSADGSWRTIGAEIEGDRIRLRGPGVGTATEVRYLWSPYHIATLFDTRSLPVSPFRLSVE
jgi:sialate O-acetylesterase